jgi:hypothetical protein
VVCTHIVMVHVVCAVLQNTEEFDWCTQIIVHSGDSVFNGAQIIVRGGVY